MLTKSHMRLNVIHAKENGVVLLIALIVLVAMTLAGIALVRSVDTSNIIAGNMAFQQAATHSGDVGTETAIGWLETNNTGVTLHNDILGSGYAAFRQDPAPNQTWDAFWNAVLKNQAVTLAEDASGNTVAYAIQRLCDTTGAPTVPATGCASSPISSTAQGNSEDSGSVALIYSNQQYYRITSRITGPRNTISYIQVVVAM
jgi:type IV pilus assembly protein PilX